MNEVFKKHNSKKIVLDDIFYLEPDQFRGLVLVSEEERLVKNPKTGEEKLKVVKDQWYYPKLSMVLDKYLQLKTKEAKSVEELKEIVLRVEHNISKIVR